MRISAFQSTPGRVAASVLFATALAFLVRAPEPAFGRRALSDWLNALDDPPRAQEARHALREIGPRAIPFLFKVARAQDALSKRVYREYWRLLPEAVQHRLPPPESRDSALDRIVVAFQAIGPAGRGALMAALADRSPEVRLLAALYFMRLAEADPAGAVPALAKLLDSPDYDLRQAAVGTLGTLGTNAGPAVNALVHSLQHDQIMFVRETAARSLAQLGPLAGSAQPALRVGLADPASGVRLWSAVALWQIARDPAGIPEMVSVLENTTDRTLCRTILPVLAQAGPLAEAAVPVLQSRMVEYGRVWRSNAHEKSLLILAKEALARIDPAAGIPTSEVAVKVPR